MRIIHLLPGQGATCRQAQLNLYRPLVALLGWLLIGTTPTLLGQPRTTARLVLGAEVVRPGDTFLAGVELEMPDGWHTYWRNPGDAGAATHVEWILPPGLSAGLLAWPAPRVFVTDGLTSYGYEGKVMLLTPLTVDERAVAGKLIIKAKVNWIECAVACVPGNASLHAAVEVGAEQRHSSALAHLQAWQQHVPQPGAARPTRAYWVGNPSDDPRELIIDWAAGNSETGIFIPLSNDDCAVAQPEANPTAEFKPGEVRARVRSQGDNWPAVLEGIIISQTDKTSVAHSVKLEIAESLAARPEPIRVGITESKRGSLGYMLCLAFLGGLILNVMPCVLPVIALKVLSFIGHARQPACAPWRQGLFYGGGVLISFAGLAALVISAQAAGRVANWGMQFQNPHFLVMMVILVLLVALNLFGLFELNLGGPALTAAAGLAGRPGDLGAFFNGVLATALATPCTAPFLGLALGFALTQPPASILLIFLVAGLGLATPYVMISLFPSLGAHLPKPGPWMGHLRTAMGFPMLATLIWLFSLLTRHYGTAGTLWVGLLLVTIALAVWIWGRFVQGGILRATPAVAVLGPLLLLCGWYVLERQLDWRAPGPAAIQALQPRRAGALGWLPWSAEAVARARAEGRAVLVDFTADWCMTCKANLKTSLESPVVTRRLKELGVVPMLADYTLPDEAIAAELRRWGRAGVPLVLVYSPNPDSPPIVLPELLTPGIVLAALDRSN